MLVWVYGLHRGGILDLWSNKSIICCLSYAFMFGGHVSTYDKQGPISVDAHILNRSVPV